MNRTLFTLFAFFFIVHTASAQYYTDSTAGIVMLAEVGDTVHYSMEKQRIDYREGKLTSKHVFNYDVDLTVAEAGEEYKVMHWIYRNAQVQDSGELNFNDHLGSLISNIKVVYKTDYFGTFDRIVNWKSIETQIHKRIDSIIKVTKEVPVKTVLKSLKTSLTGEFAISNGIAKDILSYHSLYGVEFTIGEALEAESELPNVLNPEKPFPGILHITMNELNVAKSYANVQYLQTLDEEKSSPIIDETLRKLMKKVPKDFKVTDFQINDKLEFQYNLQTGFMNTFHWERIQHVMDRKVIETLQIETVQR
ncbi:MAG: hypothetical protein EP332_05705 [Bacteroidetes bacterium]|nr:MAG: hypothetical protein EP332_05705 [Bacteroidota bacterium]